jgi:hypothetical protein
VVTPLVTSRIQQKQGAIQRMLDPSRDGWETESFAEVASKQLDRIAHLLESPHRTEPHALAEIVSDQFVCRWLRPPSLRETFRDETMVVRVASDQIDDGTAPLHTGSVGLAAAIEAFCKPTASASRRRATLKIYRVDKQDASVRTTVRVETAASSDSSAHQVTATWECDWTGTETDPPRLKSIRVVDHEEVTSSIAKWLADNTQTVLGHTDSFQGELRYGMDHWVNRLDRRLDISRFGHHGLAIGDVNNDGLDDVYVCQPGGLPNRLYVQRRDGSADDISAAAQVDILDYTSSAILADLDNDADQDLIVATTAAIVILSNDGTGRFRPRAAFEQCRRAFSLAIADYDLDGLLDIYACRYQENPHTSFELPLPIPYYDANNGGRNFLLRNLSHWQFQDVTAETGLNKDNTRFSFAAAWEDFDSDGDPDLYVANDYGRNCLYRNDAGRFTNIAAEAGVEDIASGMSVTWSDFDHDGRSDLYVGNMFSSAGNRVTYQRRFEEQYDSVSRSQIQRHARGNTLFRSLGPSATGAGHAFQDVSLAAGVTIGRWAWASLFADLNNDSWDDLVVVNGLMTTEDPGDL